MKQWLQKLMMTFFLLLPCSCQTKQNQRLTIASKPMTEQFILSEMLGILIREYSDLDVKIIKGIGGGTSNIHPGIVKGEFDLYPEYTGTAWNYVLKKTEMIPQEMMLEELTSEYEKDFNLSWVGVYGFNNTFGLAVQEEIAKHHQLHCFSDIKKIAQDIIFGAEYDFFERNDGYEKLCKTYDLKFRTVVDLDIGLKYQAIQNNQVGLINIFTTDAQLHSANLRVLEDDKKVYPSYFCGTVIRKETLEKYPDLFDILMKMDGLITEKEMSEMNYQVEVLQMLDYDVALLFLQSKNLVKG